MAKRKGKSERRIKDWYSRFVSGDEDGPEARRQKLSERAVKLPPSRDSDDQDRPDIGIEDLPKAEGIVVGFFPGGALVRVGSDELLSGIAKTFRAPEGSSPLAVGDDVSIALTRQQHTDASEADKDRADGMILSRQPRRTALARPRPRSSKRRDRYDEEPFEKIIAANMDMLLIVAATRDPPLRHGLIDRYLIIAERGELEPLLVINKIDLGQCDAQVLADFEDLDVPRLFCSAVSGEGMEELQGALKQRRSVLAGASGVGKSTLINAMIPSAEAATRTVRSKDRRGRHTTSAAVVYDLPCGGIIVDTPGIRELGMKIQLEELPWYFPEFEDVAPQCRFNNCMHTHEPDCAVRLAAEDGNLSARRYGSYLRLLETLEQT